MYSLLYFYELQTELLTRFSAEISAKFYIQLQETSILKISKMTSLCNIMSKRSTQKLYRMHITNWQNLETQK